MPLFKRGIFQMLYCVQVIVHVFGSRTPSDSVGRYVLATKIFESSNSRCEELPGAGYISLQHRLFVLRRYAGGWVDGFVLEQRKTVLRNPNKWIRRRIDSCIWKSYRLPQLASLGYGVLALG